MSEHLPADPSEDPDGPFPSFTALRAAHSKLLKDNADGSAVDGPRIEDFVRRGRATGVLLDDLDQRWEAQSLLDYWATTLDRLGTRLPDAVLLEFDPQLAPELPDDACPYRGLEAFQAGQSKFFFGRARLTASILKHASAHRLVPVLGPSGSGKSSVVLAGVLGALEGGALPGSENWLALPPVVPGAYPLDSLARVLHSTDPPGTGSVEEHLESLRKKKHYLVESIAERTDGPAVLVVDQFEEIFTLCDSNDARDTFVRHLLDVAESQTSPHFVFLTMRTDFEGAVAQAPKLEEYFDKAIRVPPLNSHELRDAIVKPAEAVGLKFESGLVDQLIHDVVGEPAALPLLQFTLLKLWEGRKRNRVTFEVYKDLGGGRSALARSADRFYNAQIPEDQSTVKLILLRLVAPAEGLEVTSKRVARRRLFAGGVASDRIERVLDKLIAERLVRVTPGDAEDGSEDRIEVAHEALVRNWPTFVYWLDEERVRLRHKTTLNAAAQRWQETGRPESLLLRGPVLEEAQKYDDLDDTAAAFVRASGRQHKRQRIGLWAVVAAVMLVLSFATVSAFQQRDEALVAVARADSAQAALRATNRRLDMESRNATVARDSAAAAAAFAALAADRALDEAAIADSLRVVAERGSRISTSLRLAAGATNNVDRDPELSLLLALEAINAQQTPAAVDALNSAIRASRLERTFLGHDLADRVADAVFTPDGARVVTSSYDGTAHVWDPSSGEISLTLHGGTPSEYLLGVAVSPDGTRIVAVGDETPAQVWDAANGDILFTVGGEEGGEGVAFSPDGRSIAVGDAFGSASVWDAEDGTLLHAFFGDTTDFYVLDLAYSPDGAWLAGGMETGLVYIWNATTYEEITQFRAHSTEVSDVVFYPDPEENVGGYALATASQDEAIVKFWVLDGADREMAAQSTHPGGVSSVAFNPEGTLVVTGGMDGTARVYALEDDELDEPTVTLVGHEGAINAVNFSPDGSRIVTVSDDGSARVWTAEEGAAAVAIRAGESGGAQRVAFDTRDPDRIALAGTPPGVSIWIADSARVVDTLEVPAPTDVASGGLGRLAAASSSNGVSVWEAGATLAEFPLPGGANAVAISEDGGRVAGAGADGLAVVWSVSGRTEVALIRHVAQSVLVNRGGQPMDTVPDPVLDLALNRDGSRLIASTRYGVTVWDVDSARIIRVLERPRYDPKAGLDLSSDKRVAVDPSRERYLWTDENRVLMWSFGQAFDPLEFVQLGSPVTALEFSRDGRVATGGADGDIVLWDASTGEQVRSFSGEHGAVRDLSFSVDGSRLAAAAADGDVTVHALNLQALMAIAENKLTRGFTDQECELYLLRPCEDTDAGAALRGGT